MLTSCSDCGDEVEDDAVQNCSCGKDGLCPDCAAECAANHEDGEE